MKPENILFGMDGTIRITDFGLAHFENHYINNESYTSQIENELSDNTVYSTSEMDSDHILHHIMMPHKLFVDINIIINVIIGHWVLFYMLCSWLSIISCS
eukprot:553805_1